MINYAAKGNSVSIPMISPMMPISDKDHPKNILTVFPGFQSRIMLQIPFNAWYNAVISNKESKIIHHGD